MTSRLATAAVDPAAREKVRAAWASMVEGLRETRPAEGSTEETAALLRFMRGAALAWSLLDVHLTDVLRLGLEDAMLEAVRRELATSEVERKLALRHVEQAVHTFGVVVEGAGATLATIPATAMRDFLAGAVAALEGPGPDLSADDRAFLRFELDLAMALESFDTPLDELTYWAARALRGARRVEAMTAASQSPRVRAELARFRSPRSWSEWDNEEIARELSPWPNAPPAR